MIEITLTRRPPGKRWDRRGLLFDATARYGDSRFEVFNVHQPIRAAIRAVIIGSRGFTDCPWQLARDGRVDLSGPSARKMASLTDSEGDQGTHFRADNPARAAFYAPSPTSGGRGCRTMARTGIKQRRSPPPCGRGGLNKCRWTVADQGGRWRRHALHTTGRRQMQRGVRKAEPRLPGAYPASQAAAEFEVRV